MSVQKENPRRRFLRPEKLPHFFCSGCGCGQVLNYYTQALEELNMDLNIWSISVELAVRHVFRFI